METLELITRHDQVLTQINEIKKVTQHNFIALCELLHEASTKEYHLVWGFPRFGGWVETSGLGMKERQAYYLINIWKKALELGIDKATLENTQVSSLKAIMQLKPSEDAEVMVSLLAAAEDLSAEEVSQRVSERRQVRGLDEYETMKFRVTTEGRQMVIEPALELVRRSAGGERELTDGECLEYLCSDQLAGAGDPLHMMKEDIVDVVSVEEL